MNNTIKNILTALGIAAVLAEGAILMICRASFATTIFAPMLVVLSIGCILIMRFAYGIARWQNKMHMWQFKKFEDDPKNYEPSRFAVNMTVLSGALGIVFAHAMIWYYLLTL